jgi:two-component system aerobic respiration control sensor histidine kinase ArcB
MGNRLPPATHDFLADKDKTIAELNDLIRENAENHQHALQEKVTYYENILALMPGYVYWLDRNNVYLGCNDIQAKKVKLSSRHDIVGKRTKDLLSREEQAIEVDKLNNRVMETGVAHSEIESGTMQDGERVYFSQKVPLRGDKNTVIGLLGISIDITELKNTEAALTVAKERAEAANRAKIEFIANMSHDIRTPLSGVIGISHLLEERLTHPEEKQLAQWVHQSGEQLLNLLNSIMDIVSAENVSDSDLREDVFDLRQCLEDIVQLERPTTVLKNIGLNVEIDEHAPQYIVTDRAKLHRVLLNLLGNAIKFTETGFITLDVKLIEVEEDKAWFQFQVIDTGIGISAEHQDKIFDRFFRASSSYKGVYSGYGVGLHIAQSYVKLLGGDLKFTSQEGMGTTFYFDLPAKIAKMEEPEIFDVREPRSELSNRIGIPHLLLIEDNAIALRMVELMATQAGCRFTSAMNGEDALALVKSVDFDLIITDIGLPDFPGYELARQIREWEAIQHRSAVPIVGLTAHVTAKSQCVQAGMNDVFCKPLNLQVMESILMEYADAPMNISHANQCGDGFPDQNSQLFMLEQFPLLDLDHAVQRIGDKTVLIEMLHLMARQEIPNDEQTLKIFHAAGDWEAIEKLAHKMKGGAVYCGTFKMQYACQYLERYRKAGYTRLLEDLYQQLLQVLEETKQTILREV